MSMTESNSQIPDAMNGVHCMLPTAARGLVPQELDGIPQVTVSTFSEWRRTGRPVVLVDVRNPDEYSLRHIEGSVHIPLPELGGRISSLDKAQQYVLQCASGGRSQHAAKVLRQHGFRDVFNLVGGINAWVLHAEAQEGGS